MIKIILVCRSANKVKMLENYLNAAENIIGSFYSCSINFRTMWCKMACPHDLEKFMRTVIEKKELNNLADYFFKYLEKKDKILM